MWLGWPVVVLGDGRGVKIQTSQLQRKLGSLLTRGELVFQELARITVLLALQLEHVLPKASDDCTNVVQGAHVLPAHELPVLVNELLVCFSRQSRTSHLDVGTVGLGRVQRPGWVLEPDSAKTERSQTFA